MTWQTPRPITLTRCVAALGALIVLVPAAAALAGQDHQAETPPTETILGVPVYPSATFLTSYDAGQGQRFYLYGTQTGFEDMVRYYEVVLDERGDRVFDAPAVHVFETGRFREDRMAFPPSVTIKDYTWNGSEGFLDPAPGGSERFATIIQIVPAPAGESR